VEVERPMFEVADSDETITTSSRARSFVGFVSSSGYSVRIYFR
jgi:hypothetical protein